MKKVRVTKIHVVPKRHLNGNSTDVTASNNEIQQSDVLKSVTTSEKPPAYSTPPSIAQAMDALPVKSAASRKLNKLKTNTSTSRLLLIIVAVFISVILVAIVAIGIYGLVILTSTTTKSATTVTTTTTTSTVTIVYPSECSNYTTINEITRLGTAFVGTSCDNGPPFYSSISWFRFVGVGGTMLANYTVPIYRCSTTYAGWYTGSLPTDGNSVTGLVCFSTTTTNCASANVIAVTNCGSFYVYGLTVVQYCNSRYCTM